MKKNLKKVISSLVALTLSLSSVAAFAASFTDIPETANYAAAVNELVALKVINGYEDGTFKPDAKVTRAEVTKMVVAALGQTQSAESSKSGTIFTDVAADHWASGFINVGVNAKKFINGMGDGTFAPDGNVTYSQLVKMLVVSLNYGDMAVEQGGYPTGYMAIADSVGMTKGITGINANDELTRAQVALLIDNAVKTPLLVNTTWSQNNKEWVIKDGEGKEYQTLLTEVHKAYAVEGKVTGTNKTNSSIDIDQVNFYIDTAKNFDGEYYKRTTDERSPILVYTGDTTAANYLLTYASAIIQKNEDDDYVLLSISATGKNESDDVAADAFDYENKNYSSNIAEDLTNGVKKTLYYYDNSKKTGSVKTYRLSDTPGLYVNGVEVDWDEDAIQRHIIDNKTGNVTLLDVPTGTASSVDGKYDYVFVSEYLSGVVEAVSSSLNRITFRNNMTGLEPIELDDDKVEDKTLNYSIRLDGKEIKPSELQENDVISVGYDVNGNITDSSFYDIIVTRGTVEGLVKGKDNNEGYEIGDKYYKPADFEGSDDATLKVGGTYTLYIDAFNRIIDQEQSASTKKLAILDNVYPSEDGTTIKATIVLPDGTPQTYVLKTKNDETKFKEILFGENPAEKDPVKLDAFNRVIEYKINSSNEISLENEKAVKAKEISGSYKASSSKIGTVVMTDDAKLLDIVDYNTSDGTISDIETVSTSSLTVDKDYEGYAFDRVDSNGKYRFVMITKGLGDYSDDTQVAVFVKDSAVTDKNGEATKGITVLFDGKETTLIADPDEYSSNSDLGLSQGDVVLIKVNGSDQVTKIETVFDNNLSDGYEEFSEKVFKAAGVDGKFSSMFTLPDEWTEADSEVDVAFGPITLKSGSIVTLARPIDSVSLASNDVDYTVSSDTKVYIYNYKKSSSNRVYAGTVGDIAKTEGIKTTTESVDWTSKEFKNKANFAFVKADDSNNAQQIVVVLANY